MVIEFLTNIYEDILCCLQGIVIRAVSYIEQTYNGAFSFNRLLNGYRRSDPARGVEYIIDAQFADTTTGKSVNKR